MKRLSFLMRPRGELYKKILARRSGGQVWDGVGMVTGMGIRSMSQFRHHTTLDARGEGVSNREQPLRVCMLAII